jgi:hypothetical protein
MAEAMICNACNKVNDNSENALYDERIITKNYKLNSDKSIECFGKVLTHAEFLIAMGWSLSAQSYPESSLNRQAKKELVMSHVPYLAEHQYSDFENNIIERLELESRHFSLLFNLGMCVEKEAME